MSDNAQQFADKYLSGWSIESKYLGETREGKYPRHNWRFTITAPNGHKIEGPFSMGDGLAVRKKTYAVPAPIGVAKSTPKLADVLYCLVSNAQSAEEPFEEWCANMGCETDSRKALATYIQCEAMGAELRLCGVKVYKLADQFSEFGY